VQVLCSMSLTAEFLVTYVNHLLTVAIDTEAGLLCQSRDQQAWNGARSVKGVTGKGLDLLMLVTCIC